VDYIKGSMRLMKILIGNTLKSCTKFDISLVVGCSYAMVITGPKPLRDRLGDDEIKSLIEGRKSSVVLLEEKFERRLF